MFDCRINVCSSRYLFGCMDTEYCSPQPLLTPYIGSNHFTQMPSVQLYECIYPHLLQAVGEPPLFLAASVFFAIKEAIALARTEREISGRFLIDSPATCERIRMACSDQFTQQVYAHGGSTGRDPEQCTCMGFVYQRHSFIIHTHLTKVVPTHDVHVFMHIYMLRVYAP